MTVPVGELSVEQRLTMLENEVREINRVIARNLEGVLPPRLLFSWPVGDITRPKLEPWFDATGYAELYQNNTQYHTGNDLNLAAFGDSGQPVYACADGVIRFAGVIANWQQSVVIMEHRLEDGRKMWSRYAHISPLPALVVGSTISRGTQVGNIADYSPKGPQGDHLHFDLAWVDLAARPGDWPGLNRARVLTDYVDPAKWILDRLALGG